MQMFTRHTLDKLNQPEAENEIEPFANKQ